jgi:pteridine reductase
VTGAARRIGADIVRTLHAAGMDIVLHCNHSLAVAQALQQELETLRPNSVLLLQADLRQTQQIPEFVAKIAAWRHRLDLLVNNASTFYPTPLADATEEQWDDLMGANLKAPFFLACHAAPMLRKQQGVVINLVDIHAVRPLKKHSIYSMAKAGNAMMVKSLARELAPHVRVNGVAPGVIMWSESEASPTTQEAILRRVPLARPGATSDIANTVLFLYRDAGYITGQIIAVDGGRTVQQ